MWSGFSLRTRIFIILIALVFITLGGGVIMVWYTYQIESLFTSGMDRNLDALRVAEGLESSLVNQKGYVSYYFLDRDPKWLKALEEHRRAFVESLKKTRDLARTDDDLRTIDEIDAAYARYIADKDRVIGLYKAGKTEAGVKLHKDVRVHFFKTLKLCERYRQLNYRRIDDTRRRSLTQASRLRIIAASAMTTAMILGGLLFFVLVRQILEPIRRLARETDRGARKAEYGDEVATLEDRVHGLMEDMDHTQTELLRSREVLVQAEKLALVGKLAAGVAHSIRNPLTSVKMRLFSLGRTLELSRDQSEDFEVISEEIGNIDNIVRNFLEFSRRPKLKIQRISPSDVAEMALQLLKHRLEAYNARVEVKREDLLPEVEIDPEQIKEVLVNLIINACEAMGHRGGRIVIEEAEVSSDEVGDAVEIRVNDEGPGVPESVCNFVFEPFYSTKEEGTGLGLAIARRIVTEHGGRLSLHQEEGRGACFTVILPKN
jgi:signal transduction histidine kinase